MADDDDPKVVDRRSVAFYEAVARGCETARDTLRHVLAQQLHDASKADDAPAYGPDLSIETLERWTRRVDDLLGDPKRGKHEYERQIAAAFSALDAQLVKRCNDLRAVTR